MKFEETQGGVHQELCPAGQVAEGTREPGDDDHDGEPEGKRRRIFQDGEAETPEVEAENSRKSEAVEGGEFDGDEGVKPVVRKGPSQPTAEEIATHRCTHIPYRSWCRACVLGQCPDAASHSIAPVADRDEFCKIGMDYAYMTQRMT